MKRMTRHARHRSICVLTGICLVMALFLCGPVFDRAAWAQVSIVHDTQTAFNAGTFDQTVLGGIEAAPEISLDSYLAWHWVFQDTEISGWNYNTQGSGNFAGENPPGQIHLRAEYVNTEAYAFASRNDVAVPMACVVEFEVFLDAIGPSDIGGTYNQPRGACARLDVQRAGGGFRMDIFTDKMVSFYREGTTGYNYPTLTELDIATETGRWYTYRLECDFTAMQVEVYRDGQWVGTFAADARNAATQTLRMLAYSRVLTSGLAEFHIDSIRLGAQTQALYQIGTYTSGILAVEADAVIELSWAGIPAYPYPWAPWVKSPGNPILPASCLNENILCDADDPLQQPILYNGMYWMVYATGGAGGTIRLAHTSDPTLDSWTNYAGNPILAPSADGPSGAEDYVFSPHLFKDGDLYYLFYDVAMASDGRQRVAYATASSPLGPWTKGQNILDRGAPGEWDDYRVTEPYVWKEGDTYFLYYMGDHICSGCNEQIGLATTTADLFPLGPEPGGLWTKHGLVLPHNPDPAGWDRGLTADPSIIKVDDVFFMRYTGSYADEHWELGTAWATSPYGPWHRPAAPDIRRGPPGSWDDDRLVRGAIHYHQGRYYSPYTGFRSGFGYRGGIASADPAMQGDDLLAATRTSPDGVTWEEWRPVVNGGQIASSAGGYLQYQFTFNASPEGHSPILTSVTIDQYSDNISVADAEQCVSTVNPCAMLAVIFNRLDDTPVGGISVTFQLSEELALCGTPAGSIQAITGEGSWLGNLAHTFQVYSLGGGAYTADLAILGADCGPTASGALFRVEVTHAPGVADAVGTVTVTEVLVRDCANAPLPGVPGAPGTVVVDMTPPAALQNLAALQVKDADDPANIGTTRIKLHWDAADQGDAAWIRLYRIGYGGYPLYTGAEPAAPSDPVAEGWLLVADDIEPTAVEHVDYPDTRDFWYYVAFVQDECGNLSAASALTGGTLSYHLGDVMPYVVDPEDPGEVVQYGDNKVEMADVSHLGMHYGMTSGFPAYLDVGPTFDFSVDHRPVPDGRLDFEDLMVFAINFEQVGKSDVRPPTPAAVNELVLVPGEAGVVGTTFQVQVRLAGDGRIQGLSVPLTWDDTVAEPVGHAGGDLLQAQGGLGMVLSPEPGTVDAALLGVREQGISGEGVLAAVTFRVKSAGDPRIGFGIVLARDVHNEPISLQGAVSSEASSILPQRTALMPAAPNPFNPATELKFAIAREGPVKICVYSLRGRLVATLVQERLPAGMYSVVWPGTDGGGQAVASGSYIVRLQAPDRVQSQRIMLVK